MRREIARLRDRCDAMRAGLESSLSLIMEAQELAARAAMLGLLPSLRGAATDEEREAIGAVARDILAAVRQGHAFEQVAARAVDRMVLAEDRLERARVAMPALQALAQRGSAEARAAVTKLAEALG